MGRRKLLVLLGYGLAARTKPLFPLAQGIGAVLTLADNFWLVGLGADFGEPTIPFRPRVPEETDTGHRRICITPPASPSRPDRWLTPWRELAGFSGVRSGTKVGFARRWGDSPPR